MPTCQARGQIVFERTPTRTPSDRSRSNRGRTSGSVKVCGSQNSRYAVSSSGSWSSPASSNRSAIVALRWWSRDRPQTTSPAWWSAARDASGSCPTVVTAAARASDSAWKSMSCQRVSVPPQSKMTASMSTRVAPSRVTSGGADHAHEVVDHVVDRDVLPLAGTTVADLDGALGQVAPDHDDGRDADQLGVLELHAWADLGPVVVQDGDAVAGELAHQPVGVREDLVVLAGGDHVDIRRGDVSRPAQPQLVERA